MSPMSCNPGVFISGGEGEHSLKGWFLKLSRVTESYLYYIKALASRLLATEELTAKEAVAYIKAPREGRGYQPMMRPWRSSDEPRAKRPRTAQVPENRATEGTESLGLNLKPFPQIALA